MKIKPYFKWFDFWVGWFYDTNKKILYIGLLPMIGIKIDLLYVEGKKRKKGENGTICGMDSGSCDRWGYWNSCSHSDCPVFTDPSYGVCVDDD
jgi:hypothetical protein